MEETNPRGEATHHRRQIVVSPDAQRSCAEGDPVRIQIRLRHKPLEIVCRTYDPRQSQQRPRRIIRMNAQLYPELRGHRTNQSQKLSSVLAKTRLAHFCIFDEQIPHSLQSVAAVAAWQSA